MTTETDYTPWLMQCAKCGHLMRLAEIKPSVPVGADGITYRCPFCNHEEQRIRKPIRREAARSLEEGLALTQR
jgi:hypothetical protein